MSLSSATTGGFGLISALAAGHGTVLFLAGVMVLLGVGVLIGSSLHTRSVDEKYRRLAQHVRRLNEQEAALDARRHSPAIYGGCPLEQTPRGTLLVRERPPLVDEDC